MEYLKYRLGAKKATIRLKVGTLRAKWLQEFKQEENIIVLSKFKKRYFKGCYKVVLWRYYIKDKLIMLIIIY